MPLTLLLSLSAVMLATGFLSGVFGMAGGMILIGVLLAVLPVPEAMTLHAVTQLTSNCWRATLWIKYVRWRAAGYFLCGCVLAFALWSAWGYVPSRSVALLLLGVSPFLVWLIPRNYAPNPERLGAGLLFGALAMALMLVAGVSGPLIDTYFLGGGLERREIIATKAICQVFSHAAKFVYFGALTTGAAALDPWLAGLAIVTSIVGTSLAKPVLHRMSDGQYRLWARHIITAIALVYLAQGGYFLWVDSLASN